MTDRPLIPPPPNYAPTVGPSAPAEPEPDRPAPAGADRLPRWWKKKPLLDAPSEPEPDDEDEPEEQPDEPDESAPSRKGNAAKKPAKKRRTDDRSLRVIVFNGAAAGVGYSAGLVPVFGQWLPVAEQAATGMLGLALAIGGAVAAWKLTGHPAVRPILPYAPVTRTLATLGAAEICRRWAPVPAAWLNEQGAQWGLGASAASLLLTAGGMCGGLYFLIDRRARAWHWTARLVVRIPLASALLATALYAPGPTT
ncbi:hypothetical protein [Streptomyces sp. RTd22]|uniref:hypothetical protein n=1 Tax=Streptomyces sp. RTd22 TaxID=1841249 RepID=UPI0007C59224|nr:hypothetical protein [Streptomyces sp. RTd22]